MKAMNSVAILALASSGLFGHIQEPYPGHRPGPTCYGSNYSYHVWNLFAPQDVYGVDSCVAAQLVAQRNAAGNVAMYVSLVASKVPVLGISEVVFVMAFNTSTQYLASCASRGTGVEFVQDSRTGAMVGCRPQ